MDGPVLVTIGHRHVGEFRPELQQRLGPRNVAGTHKPGEPVDGDPVHVRLEFRPALETVAPRKDQLSLVEGKAAGSAPW